MRKLLFAILLFGVVGCDPAMAQGLDVRNIARKTNVDNLDTTDTIKWYAHESIRYSVHPTRKGGPLNIAPYTTASWIVTDDEGTVWISKYGSLTNNVAEFTLDAGQAALPEDGTYTSYVALLQGEKLVGVIDKAFVKVLWQPIAGTDEITPNPDQWAAVLDMVEGVLSNALEQIHAWETAAQAVVDAFGEELRAVEGALQYAINDNGLIYEDRDGELWVVGYKGNRTDVTIPAYYNGMRVRGIAYSARDSFKNLEILRSYAPEIETAFVEVMVGVNISIERWSPFTKHSKLREVYLYATESLGPGPHITEEQDGGVFWQCTKIEKFHAPKLKFVGSGTFKEMGNGSLIFDAPNLVAIGASAFARVTFFAVFPTFDHLEYAGHSAMSGVKFVFPEVDEESFLLRFPRLYEIPPEFLDGVQCPKLALRFDVAEIMRGKALGNITSLFGFWAPRLRVIDPLNFDSPAVKNLHLPRLEVMRHDNFFTRTEEIFAPICRRWEASVHPRVGKRGSHNSTNVVLKKIYIGMEEALPRAFYNCVNLELAVLPNMITGGSRMFSGCTNLQMVMAPRMISGGYQQFEDCGNLGLVLLDSLRDMGDEMFMRCTMLRRALSYYPAAKNDKDTPTTTWPWKEDDCWTRWDHLPHNWTRNHRLIYAPMVETLGKGSLRDTSIEWVNLPALKRIGSSALHTTPLKNFYAPNVISVEEAAFANAGAPIQHIRLDNALYVGRRAFYRTRFDKMKRDEDGNLISSPLSFPAAQTVEEEAFAELAGVWRIELPAAHVIHEIAFTNALQTTDIYAPSWHTDLSMDDLWAPVLTNLITHDSKLNAATNALWRGVDTLDSNITAHASSTNAHGLDAIRTQLETKVSQSYVDSQDNALRYEVAFGTDFVNEINGNASVRLYDTERKKWSRFTVSDGVLYFGDFGELREIGRFNSDGNFLLSGNMEMLKLYEMAFPAGRHTYGIGMDGNVMRLAKDGASIWQSPAVMQLTDANEVEWLGTYNAERFLDMLQQMDIGSLIDIDIPDVDLSGLATTQQVAEAKAIANTALDRSFPTSLEPDSGNTKKWKLLFPNRPNDQWGGHEYAIVSSVNTDWDGMTGILFSEYGVVSGILTSGADGSPIIVRANKNTDGTLTDAVQWRVTDMANVYRLFDDGKWGMYEDRPYNVGSLYYTLDPMNNIASVWMQNNKRDGSTNDITQIFPDPTSVKIRDFASSLGSFGYMGSLTNGSVEIWGYSEERGYHGIFLSSGEVQGMFNFVDGLQSEGDDVATRPELSSATNTLWTAIYAVSNRIPTTNDYVTPQQLDTAVGPLATTNWVIDYHHAHMPSIPAAQTNFLPYYDKDLAVQNRTTAWTETGHEAGSGNFKLIVSNQITGKVLGYLHIASNDGPEPESSAILSSGDSSFYVGGQRPLYAIGNTYNWGAFLSDLAGFASQDSLTNYTPISTHAASTNALWAAIYAVSNGVPAANAYATTQQLAVVSATVQSNATIVAGISNRVTAVETNLMAVKNQLSGFVTKSNRYSVEYPAVGSDALAGGMMFREVGATDGAIMTWRNGQMWGRAPGYGDCPWMRYNDDLARKWEWVGHISTNESLQIIDQARAGMVTSADLQIAINSLAIPNTNNLATIQQLTIVSNMMASRVWVEDYHAANAPDLSGYAKTTTLTNYTLVSTFSSATNALWSSIRATSNSIPSTNGFATTNWVTNYHATHTPDLTGVVTTQQLASATNALRAWVEEYHNANPTDTSILYTLAYDLLDRVITLEDLAANPTNNPSSTNSTPPEITGSTWTVQTNAGKRTWTDVATSQNGLVAYATANNSYIWNTTDGETWTADTASGLKNWKLITCSYDGTTAIACTSGADYLYRKTAGGAFQAMPEFGAITPTKIALSGDGLLYSGDGCFGNRGSFYGSPATNGTINMLTSYIYSDVVENLDSLFIVRNRQVAEVLYRPSVSSSLTWSAWGHYTDSTILASRDFDPNHCALADTNGSYIGWGSPATAAGNRKWQKIVIAKAADIMFACADDDYIYRIIRSVSGSSYSYTVTSYSSQVPQTAWRQITVSDDGTRALARMEGESYLWVFKDGVWAAQTDLGKRDWRDARLAHGGYRAIAIANGSDYIYTAKFED